MAVSRRELLAAPFAALANEPEGLISRIVRLEKAVEFLARFNPPIGAVIPYLGRWPEEAGAREKWEDDIGWLLCDGRSLTHPKYVVLKKTLNGMESLPTFVGRIARGRKSDEAIGNADGADEIPEHKTGKGGEHAHPLPTWSGLMGRIPGDLAGENKKYSIEDDDKGWRANEGEHARHLEVTNGDNDEGQHRHELGGDVGRHDGHEHSIPKASIVPSYVAVNYIIKFKELSDI